MSSAWKVSSNSNLWEVYELWPLNSNVPTLMAFYRCRHAAVLKKYELVIITYSMEIALFSLLRWFFFYKNPLIRTFIVSLQLFADALVKKAYDNWMYVIEYDGKCLLNPKPKKKAASTGQAETNAPVAAGGLTSYQQHLSSNSIPGLSSGEQHLRLGYNYQSSVFLAVSVYSLC